MYAIEFYVAFRNKVLKCSTMVVVATGSDQGRNVNSNIGYRKDSSKNWEAETKFSMVGVILMK